MASTATDRIDGVNAGKAVKVPCRVATVANITLSGLQTIDGVVLVAGDRVLVKNQTAGAENGIYCADTGSWVRAKDFNGPRDATEGTLIFVTEGSGNADTFFQLTTSGAITFGTTALSFVEQSSSISGNFQSSVTGAVARLTQQKLEDRVSLYDFMTDAEKAACRAFSYATDVTTAVQSAIDSGEALWADRGGYLVSGLGWNNDGGSLVGVAPHLSVFRLANGANDHVFDIANESAGLYLANFSVDGNRANNSSGHCLRGESLEQFLFENLWVHDSPGYGMGFQGDGSFKHGWIKSCRLYNLGNDGIDFKNRNDDNEDLHIIATSVDDFDLEAAGSKAGIDIRGPCHLQGIFVRSVNAGSLAKGVRFRAGELLDANGFGGHYSSLNGFRIIMAGGGSPTGVAVDARFVSVSDGVIEEGAGASTGGANASDDHCSFSGVKVDSVSQTGVAMSGNYGKINDCVVDGAGGSGSEAGYSISGDHCQASDNIVTNVVGSTSAIRVTGDNNEIYDNHLDSADIVNDTGTSNIIRNRVGYVTENWGTASDTTDGSGNVDIPHGLSTTPTFAAVHLAGDNVNGIDVQALGATNVQVRVKDAAGADVTSTAVTIYWEARV